MSACYSLLMDCCYGGSITWNFIPKQFVSGELLQTVIFHYRTTSLTERGKANKFFHSGNGWVGKECVQKRWLVLLLQLEQQWSGKHEYWPTLMNQREIWFERNQ